MRNLVVIVLAICLLGQSLGAVSVFVRFYANRDSIIEKECTYRLVKVNTCKGECVLIKQLNHVQDQDTDKPDLKLKEVVYLNLSDDGVILNLQNIVAEEVVHHTDSYQASFKSVSLGSVFHPPLV